MIGLYYNTLLAYCLSYFFDVGSQNVSCFLNDLYILNVIFNWIISGHIPLIIFLVVPFSTAVEVM